MTLTQQLQLAQQQFQYQLQLAQQQFQYQLLVTFTGIILLIVGLSVNRRLERYKSRLALETEVAKQRVTKISEAWSSMYEWESVVKDMIRGVAELQVKYAGNKQALEQNLKATIQPLED